jgi:hypothetical protein
MRFALLSSQHGRYQRVEKRDCPFGGCVFSESLKLATGTVPFFNGLLFGQRQFFS